MHRIVLTPGNRFRGSLAKNRRFPFRIGKSRRQLAVGLHRQGIFIRVVVGVGLDIDAAQGIFGTDRHIGRTGPTLFGIEKRGDPLCRLLGEVIFRPGTDRRLVGGRLLLAHGFREKLVESVFNIKRHFIAELRRLFLGLEAVHFIGHIGKRRRDTRYATGLMAVVHPDGFFVRRFLSGQ